MEKLNIKTLNKIIENLPEDFELKFKNNKHVSNIADKVEINISDKIITFHKY